MAGADFKQMRGREGPSLFSFLLADDAELEATEWFRGDKECDLDWQSCVCADCGEHRQLQEQHFKEPTRWGWRSPEDVQPGELLPLVHRLVTGVFPDGQCEGTVVWTVAKQERALLSPSDIGDVYLQRQVVLAEPLEGRTGFALLLGQYVVPSGHWPPVGYCMRMDELCEVGLPSRVGGDWDVLSPSGCWCVTTTTEGLLCADGEPKMVSRLVWSDREGEDESDGASSDNNDDELEADT